MKHVSPTSESPSTLVAIVVAARRVASRESEREHATPVRDWAPSQTAVLPGLVRSEAGRIGFFRGWLPLRKPTPPMTTV
jgi:hypothetical protein